MNSVQSLLNPRLGSTSGLGRRGLMNLGLSICLLFFRLSVFQSGSFLVIGSLVFSETQHGFRGPYGVVRDSQIFEENYLTKNGEKFPKIGFFEFIGKFSNYFFLNSVYKESLYYMLYSCTNAILEKNLIPEIWAKMALANQIAGFFKLTIFLEQNDEKAWFFAYWCRFMGIVRSLKNIGMGLRLWFRDWTLKLIVSQKGLME